MGCNVWHHWLHLACLGLCPCRLHYRNPLLCYLVINKMDTLRPGENTNKTNLQTDFNSTDIRKYSHNILKLLLCVVRYRRVHILLISYCIITYCYCVYDIIKMSSLYTHEHIWSSTIPPHTQTYIHIYTKTHTALPLISTQNQDTHIS